MSNAAAASATSLTDQLAIALDDVIRAWPGPEQQNAVNRAFSLLGTYQAQGGMLPHRGAAGPFRRP